MKSKSLMLMVLSMGFGLIAAIGISQVMGRSKTAAAPVTQMGPVLVAADHLDVHTELTEENVKIENWPANIIPEGAATSLEDIDSMVVNSRVGKGMPLLAGSMIHETEKERLGIPEGFKVSAIKVSGDDTIHGLLNPGDKVDIIGFFKKRGRDGQMQTTSRTFLKGLRVYSVDGNRRAGNREESSKSGGAIVGVLVNEKQSEDIYYVQKTGEIKLVLRGDYHEGDDNPESLDDIMDWDTELADDDDDSSQPEFDQLPPPLPGKTTNMVVWQGKDPQIFTFQGESGLPTPTNPYDSPPSNDEEEEYVGEEDSGEFIGSEEDTREPQQD